jgi:hypothetical protein
VWTHAIGIVAGPPDLHLASPAARARRSPAAGPAIDERVSSSSQDHAAADALRISTGGSSAFSTAQPLFGTASTTTFHARELLGVSIP